MNPEGGVVMTSGVSVSPQFLFSPVVVIYSMFQTKVSLFEQWF